MDSIKKAISRQKYVTPLLVMFLFVALILALSACGQATANASSTSEGSQAPTPPPVDQNTKQFGDVVDYGDGVSIKVEMIGEFTPSNLGYMPLDEGTTAIAFKITVKNESDRTLDLAVFPEIESAGVKAKMVSDAGNIDFPDLGLFPSDAVLPGDSVEWYSAYAVLDPSDVTMTLSPESFTYEDAVFTNVPF